MNRIIITSGDIEGIGLEVSCKALEKIGPRKNTLFVVMTAPKPDSIFWRRVQRKFRIHEIESWPEVLTFQPRSRKDLVHFTSRLAPAKWVELAATACLHKKVSALVTGPLSKPEIVKAGLRDLGHTDILKRVSSTSSVWMTFLGRKFNVVLATGHCPLEEVPRRLSRETLLQVLRDSAQFFGSTKKPLGVLGLNPHAGDQGLIGRFEAELLSPVLEQLKQEGVSILGPLVPDVAFARENWKKYGAYVALYHDQGLIPFKVVHGRSSGVHMSLGLPFLRTSVDHGIAQDIWRKDKADPGSMIDAIEKCLDFIQKSSIT